MLTWTTGSFIPPTTTADPVALATQAQTLMDQSGRIIGRGSEVAQQITTTAVNFSELVAAPLKQHSGFSLQASEKAMEGAAWGSTVTGRWSTDVQTFIDTTTALKTDWDTAVGNHFGISPSAYATVEEFHAAVNAAGAVKYQEVTTAANAAYDTFKTQASTAGQQLAGGPTTANLQALAAGGAGGSWAMFNLFGAQAGPPVFDGTTGGLLADEIRGYIDRGEAIPPGLLDDVKRFALEAQALQQAGAGAKLLPNQIDYLGGFFNRLDVTNTLERLPEAIRALVPVPGDQTLMLGALGGGLLALSDSRVGGAADKLPPSLAGLIERQLGTGGPVGNGEVPTYKIAPMLAALRDPLVGLEHLEGGKELSGALTLEVAQANLLSWPNFTEEAKIDVLDIATRNHAANAALLTAGLEHPEFGLDTPEHVLRGVFGHDWSDHGAAAAGLIDWINADSTSDIADIRNQAAHAAYGLFDNITDTVVHDKYWSESALDFFRDGFGNIEGHARAPLGAGNPAVAMAMGQTVLPYFDVFDDASTGPANLLRDAVDPITGQPYVDLYLTRETRENYFELVMANKDAGNALGNAAYAHIMSQAATADDWLDDHEAVRHGQNAGTLYGLLDTGFKRAFDEAVTDGGEETTLANQQVNWARAGAAAAKEIITELPFVKGAGRASNILVRELTETFKWMPGVAQAHDYMWGKADVPGPYERESDPDYMKFQYAVVHSIVEKALADQGDTTGITLQRIHDEGDRRLLDPNGQLLRADVVLQADYLRSIAEPGENLDHQLAREKLQRLFPDGFNSLDVKTNAFLQAFIDQRAHG